MVMPSIRISSWSSVLHGWTYLLKLLTISVSVLLPFDEIVKPYLVLKGKIMNFIITFIVKLDFVE